MTPAVVGVASRDGGAPRSARGVIWRVALTLVAVVAIAAGAAVYALPRG